MSVVTMIPVKTMRPRLLFSKRRCMKFPPIITAFSIMKVRRKGTSSQRGMWKASAPSMDTVTTSRRAQVIQ
jgi:hypothetical protein